MAKNSKSGAAAGKTPKAAPVVKKSVTVEAKVSEAPKPAPRKPQPQREDSTYKSILEAILKATK